MNQARHFESYTIARRNLRAVLDAAEAGLVTTVTRDSEKYLVVPARQLRDELAALRPSRAEVLAEGGGWAVILPGLPVHGDGETFDAALDDAVVALREYAEDWNDRLRTAPNHAPHRPVVELVELSTDEQLRDWLLGGAMTAAA
ncbi:hypothetical protein [Actinoplanes couchii]|uniref:Prevent-host-death protein n=1 Tax=Actinoplanes couchii TaxID=403638 RepID=A0ABQ3XPD1_9ACTN|nr:hypothetical protein [Actinoplanes couchii]MDR6315833.1 putative RNase H-like HicB family nuclease [Actinoplanes couchii]GID60371.1 hypothetical protein Aco03nite_087750 [Actinoplanes couchii]